jgi:hypothetical protein
MKLLVSSLDEYAKKWFKNIFENHLHSYHPFTIFFKKRLITNKDTGMLLMQFKQINKKENEKVKEFHTIFDKFFIHIPKDLCPLEVVILLHYLNSFERQFGFILKEKMLDSSSKAKEYTM